MSFKWFDPRPQIKNTTISFAKNYVTIDSRGKEYLDSPKFVTIGFDDEALEVKIQAVEISNPLKIDVYPFRDNIRINVPGFIAETGISGKFIGEYQEKKEMIIVKIPKSYFEKNKEEPLP